MGDIQPTQVSWLPQLPHTRYLEDRSVSFPNPVEWAWGVVSGPGQIVLLREDTGLITAMTSHLLLETFLQTLPHVKQSQLLGNAPLRDNRAPEDCGLPRLTLWPVGRS